MLFGIPVIGNIIAPRCTFADNVLLLDIQDRQIKKKRKVNLQGTTSIDLVDTLVDCRVSTFICCGISNDTIQSLHNQEIFVIENVASSLEEAVLATKNGVIYPGFGFDKPEEKRLFSESIEKKSRTLEEDLPKPNVPESDCTKCDDKVCLKGKQCPISPQINDESVIPENRQLINLIPDFAFDNDPQLCRISELIYFCLEMGYKKVGIAYCAELSETAGVLNDILSRFFQVYPVSCKIVNANKPGIELPEANNFEGVSNKNPCNPIGQAEVLSQIDTDINVVCGLCMGADCLFNSVSKAPVTTLFVKDRALANNPIGALHSKYYLAQMADQRTKIQTVIN